MKIVQESYSLWHTALAAYAPMQPQGFCRSNGGLDDGFYGIILYDSRGMRYCCSLERKPSVENQRPLDRERLMRLCGLRAAGVYKSRHTGLHKILVPLDEIFPTERRIQCA